MKWTVFSDNGPGEMNKFTGSRDVSDFLGLTTGQQTLVVSPNDGIVLGSAEASHVQGGTQGGMTGMTNGGGA